MTEFLRRLKASWVFLRKYPYVALPDGYWTTADARALSNFLGSDTGMKFRHLRWNRVYLAQQKAITDRKDPAYAAGIAFGIFGTVAEEDALLEITLPEREFEQGQSGFTSVNR